MHNAVFDIKVIECTCGIRLPCYWDTLIGAQILDENELKSLKAQYNLHIDSSQSKYDIEHLFKGLPYAIFDPDLFALYAATDAWMTMKLWEYQAAQFSIPDNAEIFNLFMTTSYLYSICRYITKIYSFKIGKIFQVIRNFFFYI